MNTLKLILSIVACCIALQTTVAQKTNNRSSSVSQQISNGASDVEILKSWESLVLQKQIKTYVEAEKLADKTMQLAFLHGNRQLGASVTKTAYYSTLTTTLSQEIGVVKSAIQQGGKANFTQKNYKLQPDARDMQRLAGIGKIDLTSQRQLRFNLVNKAQNILVYVPGLQSAKGQKVSGKNQRKAKLPDVFSTSDVILSNGKTIATKEELNLYLNRLVSAYTKANENLKQSGTQLKGITLMQQQVAQNETQLRKKLLTKAATLIN
ncbi:MAG: hypothetical protein AB8G11_24105 [Saprospiraceae bacterium]